MRRSNTVAAALVGGALFGGALAIAMPTRAQQDDLAAKSGEAAVTLTSQEEPGPGDGPSIVDHRTTGARNPGEHCRGTDPAYITAINRTAEMVSNSQIQALARQHGLHVLNLTWEDTGRYKGSAVGPNISDMTIQVAAPESAGRRMRITCMPVIRYPNFSDRSCDLDPRDFTILVGNQHGHPLRRISLYDFLREPTAFLSRPGEWRAPKKTLLAPRDTKVLVSAQACFLPVPKEGLATFNPVLFNYQSSENNPAVLTLLATREGSSVTVIDNKRDAFEVGGLWGQRVFHNHNGQRASLTGQRMSDFSAQNHGGADTGATPAEKRQGLNMVLLVQIPLKYKEREMMSYMLAAPAGAVPMAKDAVRSRSESDVEAAVIGHGEMEGPFTEVGGLHIERDERFPIRVTVQFYKATSNGVVSEADLQEIKTQIDDVYGRSDYVGSLVTEGETGRVTEYEGVKVQPAGWWNDFWTRYERNMGIPRDEAIRRLRELLGVHYESRPVSELYVRDLLRRRHAHHG